MDNYKFEAFFLTKTNNGSLWCAVFKPLTNYGLFSLLHNSCLPKEWKRRQLQMESFSIYYHFRQKVQLHNTPWQAHNEKKIHRKFGACCSVVIHISVILTRLKRAMPGGYQCNAHMFYMTVSHEKKLRKPATLFKWKFYFQPQILIWIIRY